MTLHHPFARLIAPLSAMILAVASAVGADAGLPVTVTPPAAGEQLVRASIPFPKGFGEPTMLEVRNDDGTSTRASVRPLGWYAATNGKPREVRRGLVTFVHRFPDSAPCHVTLHPVEAMPASPLPPPGSVTVQGNLVRIALPGGPVVSATLIAPALARTNAASEEVVESHSLFDWRRHRMDDPLWPRVIEVRQDVLGRILVIAHVQRAGVAEDGFAPPLGWRIESDLNPIRLHSGTNQVGIGRDPVRHSFGTGAPAVLELDGGRWRLEHPTAHHRRRGGIEIRPHDGRGFDGTFWSVAPAEQVPMQPYGWRRFEFCLSRGDRPPLTSTLEEAALIAVDPSILKDSFGIDPEPSLAAFPELEALRRFHRDAIVRCQAVGDDWGNVTGYADGSHYGSILGMNRLNHAPPILEEAWRSGDQRLRTIALLWCENFHDQSIWWGPAETGGTRYNNVSAMGKTPLTTGYMWRSNGSVGFCTKGYDLFALAFEETGDSRFLDALRAQVAYAATRVRVDTGEARNIGDVRDFVRLHQLTGDPRHEKEALRLFRELRPHLSPDHLFSQSGARLDPNPPFINDDARGYAHPFAKPYIIGYALAGLPDLARTHPSEPRIGSVIAAVADFLATSQDPAGGWRYPHPHSANVLLSQAMEHAWQLVQADRYLGPRTNHLDAIERVLRQRIHGWIRTGTILAGFGDWEIATGFARSADDLHRIYRRPGDRDADRDYAEGRISLGSSPPEGLVYFSDVLAFYLRQRGAERLLAPPGPSEPLGRLLARTKPGPGRDVPAQRTHQSYGITNALPAFRDRAAARMDFPLSWLAGSHTNFSAWRQEARERVRAALLGAPPETAFDPVVLLEQDRGSHMAAKVVFNLTGDSRVLGYRLTPKGPGPFPAVLLLHDHGARFDIGKEKVIEPWDTPAERLQSAREWVGRYYGGRFLGEELARRGYVCFATDALNWGDRGGAGYDGQQALAANLLHLGMSHAGLIAHEDVRAARFLAGQPGVDPSRIAAMGLSMGSFRTWQVAALSDDISVGVAVCWMATVKGLMVPGNNQTRGQSAFTMTHPGLFNALDYPDVASIACPKPMLFYAGERDALFPVPSVVEAFEKLRRVWDSQDAANRLEARLWDAPHVFDRDMQEAAFVWLAEQLGRPRSRD